MNNLEERHKQFFGEENFRALLKKQRELYKNEYLRINLSKTKIEKIEDFLKRKKVIYEKGFLQNSYIIKKSFFSLSTSIPALGGEIYSQELASQIPVNLIDFKSSKKKIKILDMAASPGSKVTQIVDNLNLLNLNYEIVALEPNKKRLQKLINNIQKQECENIKIVNISGEKFITNKKFDIIFLDAPCSGNLIADPLWLKKRNLKGILEKAELQKKLLKKASQLLEKDGKIIYSTCSLEPEENEENILWAKENLNLVEEDINFKFPFKVNSKEFFIGKYKEKYKDLKSIRLQPYESNTQGFFVSVLTPN